MPVLDYQYEQKSPGMAYNAYRNIKSLGIECEIETNSNWRAIKKTRYVDTKTNQMFLDLIVAVSLTESNLTQLVFPVTMQ